MTQQRLTETMRTLGTPLKTGGNQSFLLNDPDCVWYIASGHADVFSVRIENETPVGSRHYFFSSGKGEFLFGTRYGQVSGEQGLTAVPSPDAEIIPAGADRFHEMLANPEFTELLASLIDAWIGYLSHGISKDVNPRTDRLIESDAQITLETNLKLRSKKGIIWLEFHTGNALFLGMKEIAEHGKRCVFPVSQDSWIQAMESSQVRSFRTSGICLQSDFQQHLDNFYEIIFFCEFFNTRLNTVDEFNRLNEKAFHSARTRSAALVRIASVINDNLRKTYIDAGHEPLFAACRLVGNCAGIRVTMPKQPRTSEPVPVTFGDIRRSSRFRSRTVKLTGIWWNKDNGPLLGFTKQGNYPVALIPKSSGKYEYISPAEKVRQPVTAATAALLAETGQQFYRPFPDRPVKGIELVKFGLKNTVRDIVFVILVGLAGGMLSMLVPILTGTIFDAVIPQSDHRQLYVYAMVIFFSIVAIALFQLVRSFAMIRIETKLDFSLQSAIWDRLLNLPVPFFRKYQAGELAAKANSIMLLRTILSDTVIYSVLGSVFVLFNLVLIFFYDPGLSLGILGFLLVSLALIYATGLRIRKSQRMLIQLQQKIFGMLIQFLSSISKIRIAGVEVHAFSRWAEKFSQNKRQTYAVRKLFLLVSLLSTLLPMVIALFVYGVIARQVPDTLSTGQFLAFYTALTMTIMAFLQLGMACIYFFMAIPLLESIRPILETLPENSSLKPEIQDISGDIEVANVSFRYYPEGPLVLDNISLQIQPGEFVAIVGSSGSGKSTLLRLLLGFESPVSGSVYYDRQDLSSFDPTSVRRQAGTVLQHSQLSAGNILSNICGVTSSTFEDAWEAARNVGLDDDIRLMPMGMYTMVSGGLSTLSGGQRQRIMIARAIVSKPRILFFDEATSALDNKTQQIVSDSLEKLQATRVVIAHRLTTIQNADRIYLMEQGKIIESGSYDELIGCGGKFTELVRRQMVEHA